MLNTVKRVSLLVLVWNLRFLSKNYILCGESSSTYESSKIMMLFFPSPFLIFPFPIYFPQFQKVVDAKNYIHKLEFHQLVSELRFLKSGLVCFLLCLFCPFLFNFILLFYLLLSYFFELIFLS